MQLHKLRYMSKRPSSSVQTASEALAESSLNMNVSLSSVFHPLLSSVNSKRGFVRVLQWHSYARARGVHCAWQHNGSFLSSPLRWGAVTALTLGTQQTLCTGSTCLPSAPYSHKSTCFWEHACTGKGSSASSSPWRPLAQQC